MQHMQQSCDNIWSPGLHEMQMQNTKLEKRALALCFSIQYTLCLPVPQWNQCWLITWSPFLKTVRCPTLNLHTTEVTTSQCLAIHLLRLCETLITSQFPPLECIFSPRKHRVEQTFVSSPLHRKASNDCSVLERKSIRETDTVGGGCRGGGEKVREGKQGKRKGFFIMTVSLMK